MATARRAPIPRTVGAVAPLLGSGVQVLAQIVSGHVPAPVSLALLVAFDAIGIVVIVYWSPAADWGPSHILALATGAILTYGWISIARMIAQHQTALGAPTNAVDLVCQVAFVAVVLGVVRVGAKRTSTPLSVRTSGSDWLTRLVRPITSEALRSITRCESRSWGRPPARVALEQRRL